MEVVILRDESAVSRFAATVVAREINERRGRLVMGLATGKTPLGFYRELVRMYKRGEVSFKNTVTFNLDEYIGVPASHKASFRFYMEHNFFSEIDIQKKKTNLPDGMAVDPYREAARYEQAIKRAGGIDIQILGIGKNGHIGFNEPTSSLLSRTRDKILTEQTLKGLKECFRPGEQVPRMAYTVGTETIMEAGKIILLATGSDKASIVAKAVEGPVSAMVPASVLQFHKKVKVILDTKAASGLKLKKYYSWCRELAGETADNFLQSSGQG